MPITQLPIHVLPPEPLIFNIWEFELWTITQEFDKVKFDFGFQKQKREPGGTHNPHDLISCIHFFQITLKTSQILKLHER